ncbi:hypothetical protein AMAG_01502 [Allomyces macrogynus ATCC 38327]|uniref:Uncharacterized protein n=1 Tax=Allomyces macrogynus (strain ATCC 38327) TaxID=578462 RepID=A0A0L0RZ70_ALLM3|nr:hypothetical protein AMAG_01502 [Allomyces macrogynus ATCC 38327]|eukprot:KNE55613.1 hypothetical protein AMAG_01502 [Allomyces macrogynus ATCC 38327]
MATFPASMLLAVPTPAQAPTPLRPDGDPMNEANAPKPTANGLTDVSEEREHLRDRHASTDPEPMDEDRALATPSAISYPAASPRSVSDIPAPEPSVPAHFDSTTLDDAMDLDDDDVAALALAVSAALPPMETEHDDLHYAAGAADGHLAASSSAAARPDPDRVAIAAALATDVPRPMQIATAARQRLDSAIDAAVAAAGAPDADLDSVRRAVLRDVDDILGLLLRSGSSASESVLLSRVLAQLDLPRFRDRHVRTLAAAVPLASAVDQAVDDEVDAVVHVMREMVEGSER